MRAFIKNNPTLAFGLGVPLLLVLIFSVAAGIPALLTPPPKYDVLYAVNYTNNANGYRIDVQGGHAHIVYIGENNYYAKPKLYRYSPATDSVREIAFALPIGFVFRNHQPDSGAITPIAAPELDALTLDPSSVAPDGYVFSAGEGYSYSSDWLGGLLFSPRSGYSGAFLKKGGYTLRLTQTQDVYSGNMQFIGWVVSP